MAFESRMASDDAIRFTNDDASMCKLYACSKGYWRDDFIQYFVRNSERKAPEINRGYFARVTAIRTLVDEVLRLTGSNCQIVNIGAGFDTLYWRLKQDGVLIKNFCEMDFQDVTAKKCQIIKSKKPLLDLLLSEGDDIRFNQSDLHAANYHLVSVDLRNVAEVERKLAESGIDTNIPTIFLAECVLVYMPIPQSARLISWLAEKFKSAVFINYEQVNMKDRFGEVMIANLHARDCSLPGVDCCQNLDTQKDRFVCNGWTGCQVLDMYAAYHQLPANEIQRVERLEFLDEVELLEQLFRHYCICLAYKDSLNLGLDNVQLMPG